MERNLRSQSDEGVKYVVVEADLSALGTLSIDIANSGDGSRLIINVRTPKFAANIVMDADSGEILKEIVR